jgi:putative membrane protein
MNINSSYVINSIVFSVLGLLIFAVGFWVVDKITPYNLWKEINQEKNVALAIVIGSISIGICIIIASAIHG